MTNVHHIATGENFRTLSSLIRKKTGGARPRVNSSRGGVVEISDYGFVVFLLAGRRIRLERLPPLVLSNVSASSALKG